jgi:hypothetical protein
MELHLTPEQEAHLHQIAQHEGKDPEQLVIDAALNLLQDDARTREIIRERVREADRGVFIEEDEMDARFRRMIRS